ncbi:MAG: hypothetical protein KAR01_12890 [Desulfocapsa sp.]|nr:hypothetical protein [Desulfocapsa sp.]
MFIKQIITLLCILIFPPIIVQAQEKDPVVETIEKALIEYKNNDFSNAATSLDYAGQLIRQKKGETLNNLLPEPLPGWTADEGTSKVTSAALLGGGLTAERTYTKDDSLIKITIITDSPLMQSMIMIFSNPLFAASAGQLELINGHKGVVNYQNNGGDINIVVNNRFLVTLKGKNVSRMDLMSSAKSIDLDTIGALP